MTVEEKHNTLTNELLQLKAEGLRVFINTINPNDHNNHAYGLITDETDIIYVEYDEQENRLFTTSFEYVPSRTTGSCCPAVENGYGYEHLSKKVFEESVKYGRRLACQYKATLYDNFNHYMRIDPWRKEHYTEL